MIPAAAIIAQLVVIVVVQLQGGQCLVFGLVRMIGCRRQRPSVMLLCMAAACCTLAPQSANQSTVQLAMHTLAYYIAI